MADYNREAEQIIISQELLNARMQVHNETGHVLLVSRRYMDDPAAIDEAALLQTLIVTNAQLLKEYEQDDTQRDRLSEAIEAARTIGIAVRLRGAIPENGTPRTILAAAIRECASNLRKHADGSCLTVETEENGSEICFTLVGNGRAPEKPLSETGGLSSLRSLVENAGGTMSASIQPSVTITIYLPVYTVWLSVKDEAGKTADVQGARVVVRYADDSLRVLSVTPDKANAVKGQTLTWTAAIQGGSGDKQYRFDIYRDAVIVSSTDYGTSAQVSYLAERGGVYKAKVYVKDADGKEASKLGESVSVLEILSAVPEQTSVEAGTLVPWTVSLVGETTARRLRFDLWKDGQLVEQGYYVATPTYGYVLSEPGIYTVKVSVQDLGGTLELEGAPVTVGLPVPVLAGAYRNGKLVLSWDAVSGATSYYLYRRDYNNGEWGTWALKVKATGAEWTDEAAIPGQRYEYRMRAEWDGALGGYSNTLTMPNQNPFEDVTESDACFTPVLWAYYREPQVTGGTDASHFSPAQTVMRADAMVFFWAANDRPAHKATESPFQDVKKKHWYYAAVMWAVENGITGGTDPTHFSPKRTCSRSEILQFLYAAMGKPGYTISNPYTDVKTKYWYYDGAIWAYENGMERGEDGKFNAKTPCTRASVVTYLYRFFTGQGLAG